MKLEGRHLRGIYFRGESFGERILLAGGIVLAGGFLELERRGSFEEEDEVADEQHE